MSLFLGYGVVYRPDESTEVISCDNDQSTFPLLKCDGFCRVEQVDGENKNICYNFFRTDQSEFFILIEKKFY